MAAHVHSAQDQMLLLLVVFPASHAAAAAAAPYTHLLVQEAACAHKLVGEADLAGAVKRECHNLAVPIKGVAAGRLHHGSSVENYIIVVAVAHTALWGFALCVCVLCCP